MNVFISYRLPQEKNFYTIELQSNNIRVEKPKSNTYFFYSRFNDNDIQYFDSANILENKFSDIKINVKKTNILSTSYDIYKNMFNVFYESIKSNKFNKLVLSRIIAIDFDIQLNNYQSAFNKLCDDNPNSFVYVLYNENNELWIGASPELLLSEIDNQFNTHSLAGTIHKECNWSEKEFLEQNYVTDYIIENIKTLNSTEIDISTTNVEQLNEFKHLKNNIYFKTKECYENIIKKLHPSPAICGLPKSQAKNFIINNESHNRELYSGIIGINHNNKKYSFVNIRSAQIYNNKILIYVGSGLILGSDVKSEWEETNMKSKTITKSLFDYDKVL